MPDIDITGQLRARFAEPLEHYERRRVIVWHDPEGEFAEEFAAIAADPAFVASASRRLRAVDAREVGSFELKRTVARDDVDCDLLVYADWPLDLSGAALAQDWLADVELWAQHFQADWLSLLVDEMGAEGAARDGFARFRSFFAAKARRQRFARLVPHAEDLAQVARGVVACCLGAADTSLPALTLALLDALEGDGLPSDLAKYGADAALAALLRARLGYDGPLDDREALVSTIAVSALSCTLPADVLLPVLQYVVRGREEACLALWRAWQSDEVRLLDLARLAEDANGLPELLFDAALGDLVESDVVPCTGEAAVARLMASLADGADRSAEALGAVDRRRDLSWAGTLAEFLDALEATAHMRAFQRDHAGGFHLFQASDTWDAYVSDWSRMDARYRRLVTASEPSSRAIQAEDLVNASRAGRRELVGDAKVLYVYHNIIDSTGEEFPTQDRVLPACNQALDDLVGVTKVLLNDLRINRVAVTADHGFLYTRTPLCEAQKVSLGEVGAHIAFAGRRHAITTELPEGATFVRLALEYDSAMPLWGVSPRECVRISRPGPGERYVHGGVSLQELCVPVVSVRFSDNRSKARTEQEPATLALLSTSRRVTSAIFRVDL